MKINRMHIQRIITVVSVLALLSALLLPVMGAVAGQATATNLLTADKLTSGTQSIKAYKFAFEGYELWDLQYPYTYGAASLASKGGDVVSDGHTVSNLVDGNLTQKVQFAYGDANNPDGIVSRRLALLIDLGAASDLTSITLNTPHASTYYELYDYTVYAGNVNDAATLASTDKCVGHFQTTQSNTTTATIELTGATNVQYVLIIFNKMATDPGKNGTGTAGQYGDAGLDYPKSAYQDGALILSEIAINGTPYVAPPVTNTNLLSADKLTSGDQSIKAYKFAIDGSELWDTTFSESFVYGAATQLADNRWPSNGAPLTKLFDGELTNAGFVQADFGTIGEDAVMSRRLALLIDLGGKKNLESIKLDMPSDRAHVIYDCSVYAGNTADAATLATAQYHVAHYENTSTTKTAASIALTGANGVRYVLVIFNKLSSDYGTTGHATEGDYGDNHLPFSYVDGTLRLTELAVIGSEVQLTEKNFKDNDTGVRVDMQNYSGLNNIDSFKVEKKDLTAEQKAAIEADGLFAPNGLYHFVFKDAQGAEVTDLAGWDYKVTFPMAGKFEHVYVVNAQQLPERLTVTTNLVDQTMTYAYADGNFCVDFILGSTTEDESSLPENLLTLKGLEEGSQSVTAYNLENPNLKIWDNTYPFTYGKETIRGNTDGFLGLAKKLIDGDLASKTSDFGFGSDSLVSMTDEASLNKVAGRRLSLLVDLGARCDLDTIDIIIPSTKNTKYGIYDCSVYAGLQGEMAELLQEKNLVGRFETQICGENVHVALQNASNVEYVLIVFNKVSGDPGNSKTVSAGLYGDNHLPGEAWCNGAATISELVISGDMVAADTASFKDEATGVSVDMVSYNQNAKIASMKITKNALTDRQKAVLQDEEGMVAPDGLYHIFFYDAQGNAVLDMTDRQFTVSFPMETGDEAVYVLNNLMLPTYLSTSFDLENERLYYECTASDYYFDFILATVDDGSYVPEEPEDPTDQEEPTEPDESTDPEQGADSREPESPDTGDSGVVGYVMILFALAAVVMWRMRSVSITKN